MASSGDCNPLVITSFLDSKSSVVPCYPMKITGALWILTCNVAFNFDCLLFRLSVISFLLPSEETCLKTSAGLCLEKKATR